MADAPEIEVFCGGINSKTATAAALWRQGNLLHYGFDLSPDEMNESGTGDADRRDRLHRPIHGRPAHHDNSVAVRRP